MYFNDNISCDIYLGELLITEVVVHPEASIILGAVTVTSNCSIC